MAILDTLTKNVNILPTGIPTPVHLSQSENGRTLSFEIIGGSGELPAGSVVTLTGTKPDGVVYSAVGTLSGNIATFEEDVQLTAAAGVWPAKIEVTNGGHMIATGRISFTIDADPVAPGSVPSESELDGLVAQAAMYAENARSAAYGSPLTAATAADMIDTTRVYVYTGNETGMENGHWYYWEDGAWKDGGIYNAAAVQTDTSLSIPGMAADAKATGEAIAAEATAREQADTDLKADFNNSTEAISALIFSPIDEQTRTNTNYCACSLTAGKTYKIGISVATAGTYTIHSSTAPSASYVVDLLMSNVAIEANVSRYIYYKPSVDIAYIRLSSNTVVWTVSILEGVSAVDVAENIATLQDNVTALGAESEKIGDILFDKLEKAGNNTQIFNTDNFIKVDNVYCQASGNLVSYAGCTIFTTEINASAGENFVWQFFNDAAYGSTVIGLQCFTSNVIPSVGAVTMDVGGTIDTQNKRGQLLLTSAAKYINVMVRFADANTKAIYDTEFADTLLLKIGTTYSAEYMPYYLTVAQSVERCSTGNYWAGKKIWWCGTSIPEGRDTALDSEGSGLSYPELVGQILGATVYNESLGSSMCRANVRTGDYVNAMAVNLVRAFTQTTEEKQYLIDNWQTIRPSLRDPNYYTSLESIADTVRGASFEERLMPYLNGTKPMPDLFVFDHGHNDWKTFYTMPDGTTPDTELKPTVENITNNVLAEDTYMTANSNAKLISFYTEISSIPSDKRDEFIASVNRNCFIGAVNFLCTLILSKNPRARILFIGNIDNWEKPQVQPAQEYLSESWDFHLIKMWEYLGFSGHYIPNTATYWAEEGTTDLTVKRIYCKDGVHPHSDSTGEAIELYAHIIANELRNIR